MSVDDAILGLPFDVAVDSEHVVIALSGEIDMANADSLPAVLAASVSGDSSVRIDIARVTFMDSALLRVIVQCHSTLESEGVDLKVRNAPDQARRVFEITRLTHLLE